MLIFSNIGESRLVEDYKFIETHEDFCYWGKKASILKVNIPYVCDYTCNRKLPIKLKLC